MWCGFAHGWTNGSLTPWTLQIHLNTVCYGNPTSGFNSSACNEALAAGPNTYSQTCTNTNSMGYNYIGLIYYSNAFYVACYSSSYAAASQNIWNYSATVPVQLANVSTGSYNNVATITNSGYYQCMLQMSACADDATWNSDGNGVQSKKTGYSCSTTSGTTPTCTGGTTSYRCASGYYGYSSSGVPTCTSCATTGFSNATSIAGDNSDITKCYLPVASYMDTVGTFDITGTYCNYSLDGYDHIVPPACSERVAQGCSLPTVGHECYREYTFASSGDLVCIDCSALDKDGMKMINTCYKD